MTCVVGATLTTTAIFCACATVPAHIPFVTIASTKTTAATFFPAVAALSTLSCVNSRICDRVHCTRIAVVRRLFRKFVDHMLPPPKKISDACCDWYGIHSCRYVSCANHGVSDR